MSKKNATNPFRYRKPFQVFGNQDIVMWEYVPQPHKKALVYDDKEAAKRGVKYVRCEKCGAIFEVKRKNNKTVLCPDCQAEQKREKDRDRKRRQRERVKMGRNPAYWERRIHSELANSAKRTSVIIRKIFKRYIVVFCRIINIAAYRTYKFFHLFLLYC